MIEDRIKWNKRYLEGRESALHVTLTRFYNLASPGKALDIACGTGETSIFLAKKGFKVDAFDISDIAIRKARQRARREGVKVNFKSVDAEKFSYGVSKYDLIINFYFLNRNIFSKIKRSLKQNGLLIFETYNEEHTSVRPDFNPRYLLKKGELERVFRDFLLVYYCEVSNITTLVAKKP
ncbi:methyltransferase family protein [Hydrogenivirga caldilitoris]|uniref:Methyltransferase family protein n=1 Tax=Hydrogenivirga caldilitoris TaxID=246264 RepID=A0A497XQN9_9AQUI|nr:class I SAM-dependent methyltransferase [Hydrogenivirga caldilitoris]RLJ70470.1 methyltransferase family protein [Hydrogenivirga caldilitoris]